MTRAALQSAPILQARLAEAPWDSPATARLPGTGPVAPGDWLRVDDAYAAQMALRDRLLAERREDVHALAPEAAPAARELLQVVLADLALRTGFRVSSGRVTRPDRVTVDLDDDAPLVTLGRLVQPDYCILQRRGTEPEHVMTGAVLCFPANWSLAQKFGRPLTAIHDPVPSYTGDLARRVQRLFDAVRPGVPLWRINLLTYADPDLHQPPRPGTGRSDPGGAAQYLRSERQCISRLPDSDAVIFAIHTTVVRRDALSAPVQGRLKGYLENARDPA